MQFALFSYRVQYFALKIRKGTPWLRKLLYVKYLIILFIKKYALNVKLQDDMQTLLINALLVTIKKLILDHGEEFNWISLFSYVTISN